MAYRKFSDALREERAAAEGGQADTAALIAERDKTHGPWAKTARVAHKLKAYVASEMEADHLTFTQSEALAMILSKIARIVVGDPNHPDHWNDIAGYAKLAVRKDDGE